MEGNLEKPLLQSGKKGSKYTRNTKILDNLLFDTRGRETLKATGKGKEVEVDARGRG